MVPENKDELKINNNEILNEELEEKEIIKAKIEAVMKAKAKEAAREKLEAEKQAKEAARLKLEEEKQAKEAARLKLEEEKQAKEAERLELEQAAREAAALKFELEKMAKEEARAKLIAEENKRKEEEQQRAILKAYAKYLKDNNLKPGDASFFNPADYGIEIEPEKPELTIEIPDEDIQAAIEKAEKRSQEEQKTETIQKTKEEPKNEAVQKPKEKQKAGATKKPKKKQKEYGFLTRAFAAPIELHDRIQDRIDNILISVINDFRIGSNRIIRGYRQSRKQIGITLLIVCAMCGAIVILLDVNTVYEYSYNGKMLGYVEAQEDVTNVLNIAAENLNAINEDSSNKIEFIAGDNITFRTVDASNKDIDDADATVNKLAYMTDIEVEAYGVYDGDKLVTIVKSEAAAEELLEEVKNILGTPDQGMEAISVEFAKPLEIRPINILLSSVQSNSSARKQMTEGGPVKYYHLVEKGESFDSITKMFGVGKNSIFDETDTNQLSSVNVGDKICIHKNVTPVSVKLVERGKMKEIVPYETIKKKSNKVYKGDKLVKTEGVDGVQIFEGTLTKIGGKVTDRDTESLEVITKKVDKVVIIGTAKRPKTAPTGIFINPMEVGTYVVTSRPGWRWGRTHEGVDMGAPTGTHVFASDGGTVIRAEVYGGYGNCIDIQHDNGWITRYGHLSAFAVKAGDKVYQGQYIGNVGSTGRSTGPHLHFETRKNGNFVDPDTKVVGGL